MAAPQITDVLSKGLNGGVDAISGWFYWVILIIGIFGMIAIAYWLWTLMDN